MNIIEQIEAEQAEQLVADKNHPEFGPGDTVRIGERELEWEE